MLRSDNPVRIAALARWPVFTIAGLLAVALLLTSGKYGYFGDELYFWSAGHHLDWTYADQPPLVPLLARLMDGLFPGSLVALRFPSVLLSAAGVVVAALTARELGGSRRAQVLTAGAFALAPGSVANGHVLATSTVDPVLWMTITWLLVRWIRLRQDRLLLWAGLVTAVDLQTKYLIVFFWVVAGAAILVLGPRDLLRSKMLWLGAGISVLTQVPALLWQSHNGWPQFAMGSVIANDGIMSGGGPVGFVALMLLLAGLVGIPLLGYGLWRAFRQPELRFLAVTFLGLVVVFVITGGRAYYAAGMLPVLWAVGAVGLDQVRGRWLPWTAWPVYLVSVAVAAMMLPVLPVDSLRGADDQSDFVAVESVGWPEMADAVSSAYRALPEAERSHTVILTGSYWTASAIARYGPERGLPTAYSANRGYWYFGAPPDSATTVLAVAEDNAYWARYFTNVRGAATVDNKLGVRNAFQGATIWLCGGQHEPWSTLWPKMRNL